jgi:hypothetical protein
VKYKIDLSPHIDEHTQQILETAKVINWWIEVEGCRKLVPIVTRAVSFKK